MRGNDVWLLLIRVGVGESGWRGGTPSDVYASMLLQLLMSICLIMKVYDKL
jgi:hypothetical protein